MGQIPRGTQPPPAEANTFARQRQRLRRRNLGIPLRTMFQAIAAHPPCQRWAALPSNVPALPGATPKNSLG
jgi:hypothetical protein